MHSHTYWSGSRRPFEGIVGRAKKFKQRRMVRVEAARGGRSQSDPKMRRRSVSNTCHLSMDQWATVTTIFVGDS